jgi:hypothetical protein
VGHSDIKQTDLVFCVDLSASTNGILHDVRTALWSIINETRLEQDQMIRIGVVGYARPSFGHQNYYVKILSNLTTDFDRLGYILYRMKIQVEKGDQYVPNALYETLTRINWSKNPMVQKVVYLIGNGSAYTGPLNLINICEEFRRKKIIINSIYVLSDLENPLNEKGYQTIAEMTGGRFIKITPTRQIHGQDNRTRAGVFYQMNHSFNSTMLFYTADAADRKKYTLDTDTYVLQYSIDAFIQRLRYKASEHYRRTAEAYDLISYYLNHRTLPEKINLEFLHKNYCLSTHEDIEAGVQQKALARSRLCEEINYIFRDVLTVRTEENDTLFSNIILKNIQ